MANRIVGNTYIIDTVGNLSQPKELKVISIGFFYTDTAAGEIQIVTQVDTTNVIFHHKANAINTPQADLLTMGGVYFGLLNVKVMTSATAWFHFE